MATTVMTVNCASMDRIFIGQFLPFFLLRLAHRAPLSLLQDASERDTASNMTNRKAFVFLGAIFPICAKAFAILGVQAEARYLQKS